MPKKCSRKTSTFARPLLHYYCAPAGVAACRMWIILNDACGLVCYLFGVSVVLFVDFVTVSEVIWPWLGGSWWGLGLLHALGFQVIIALILASYIKAATTDPGAVARGSASRADLYAPDADALRAYKPRCGRRQRSRRAAVRGEAWRTGLRVCSLLVTLPRRLPRVRLCLRRPPPRAGAVFATSASA